MNTNIGAATQLNPAEQHKRMHPWIYNPAEILSNNVILIPLLKVQ